MFVVLLEEVRTFIAIRTTYNMAEEEEDECVRIQMKKINQVHIMIMYTMGVCHSYSIDKFTSYRPPFFGNRLSLTKL